jgi:hypothetical protein
MRHLLIRLALFGSITVVSTVILAIPYLTID